MPLPRGKGGAHHRLRSASPSEVEGWKGDGDTFSVLGRDFPPWGRVDRAAGAPRPVGRQRYLPLYGRPAPPQPRLPLGEQGQGSRFVVGTTNAALPPHPLGPVVDTVEIVEFSFHFIYA